MRIKSGPAVDPVDTLQREILSGWQDRLERMVLHGEGERRILLIVVKGNEVDDGRRTVLNEQLAPAASGPGAATDPAGQRRQRRHAAIDRRGVL